MTIINKLAKLSLQHLQKNTNCFTSPTIKRAIAQFQKTISQERVTNEKTIAVAKGLITNVKPIRFLTMPLIGQSNFLLEMTRFLYLAESLMKDKVELDREQHVIRRLALLTILEIERLGEDQLTVEEKQVLYGFSQIALSINASDKEIWKSAYLYEERLIKQEEAKFYINNLSRVLRCFHRFLCDAEIFLTQKNSQDKQVLSTTKNLAVSLNLDKNTGFREEQGDAIKSIQKNDHSYANTLDDVLGSPSPVTQEPYVSLFKLR